MSVECSIHDYEGAPDEPCPECQWETLRAQLAECRAVLKDMEWVADKGDPDNEGWRFCPSCFSTDEESGGSGHAPDCRLAKCLSD